MTSQDTSTNQSAERSNTNNGRRRFLAGTAGAFGALALGGAFSTPVLATDEHEEGDGDDQFEDDVAVLNYARTLEALEYRFYETALNNISENDLVGCGGPLYGFGDSVRNNVYEYLGVIRDHEQTHFETLGSVIEDLGGEPVEEPEFDFGTTVEDPGEFLATAVVLEDTGVGAYAGAAPSIEDADLVPPALSIHSVEARHASFLRVLDQQVPFPEAFDEALSRSTVLERASQFIVE